MKKGDKYYNCKICDKELRRFAYTEECFEKKLCPQCLTKRATKEIITLDELNELYNKKRNKVEILWEALDYMQQYNGRSKVDCVALALGYEDTEGLAKYFYKK